MKTNEPRLTGWKEIASYLRTSIRTVQRWERTEALPIYRHYHARGTTSYALVPELDTWLTTRSLSSRRSGGRIPSVSAMLNVIDEQDAVINQLRTVIEDQRRLGRAVSAAAAEFTIPDAPATGALARSVPGVTESQRQ